MSSFEEDLLFDAEEDARAVAFIQSHLPQEMQEKTSEEAIYYFIDLLIEYYAESGILEQSADDEGYINLDLEEIAGQIHKQAQKEDFANFTCEEILLIIETYCDYEDSLED